MKSQPADKTERPGLHTLCIIVGIVGLINFVIFVVTAVILGGDAINGHEAAGHYYLANHGKLTEVSRMVFVYSKIHATSVLITHPLAVIAGIVYYATGGKRENFWKAKTR